LEENVLLFKSYLDKQDYSYEIIIVNDGSLDHTEIIAAKLANLHSNISCLNYKLNLGKGAAIKAGILECSGRFRLFLDADNASGIEHLEAVWTHFENGADLVIGSRKPKDAPGAKQIVSQNIIKQISGILANMLIRLLMGQKLYDTQCGFKIFTANAAQIVFPRCQIKRWAIDIEILSIAKLNKLKISVIPIKWVNSPLSRVGIKGYFITLQELIKIKYNLIKKNYN